ncbi:hypothetical protein SNE40_001543 [Patella caerulea]|uniref:Uncharacterized protein n=1 Tax=Patella caerulea TaxID=87958 RepID=A0AAN8KNE1_PATCE
MIGMKNIKGKKEKDIKEGRLLDRKAYRKIAQLKQRLNKLYRINRQLRKPKHSTSKSGLTIASQASKTDLILALNGRSKVRKELLFGYALASQVKENLKELKKRSLVAESLQEELLRSTNYKIN